METETSQQTPGPWEVRPSSNPENGTNWRDIVSVGTYSPYYVGEAQGADARLIAAAPELLEALLGIIDGGNIDNGTYWKVDIADIEKARAAIAKAEGN